MKNIVLLGPGQVGQALLKQLLEKIEQHSPLRIIAIADSSGLLLDMDGLTPSRVRQSVETKRNHQPLTSLDGCNCMDLLPQSFGKDTILVDTSASDEVIHDLLAGLEHGCAIAMANKKNLTQAWDRSAAFYDNPRVRFESTVCAAVPIISNLKRLVNANDTVLNIQGSLSGTLGFLCAQFDLGIPYSEAVTHAHQLGFTEPDPRDDLGGIDVGRKALIMARTNGWKLEMDHIHIESLFSEELGRLSSQEFLRQSHTLNEAFSERQRQADLEDKVLRYIARVDPQGGETCLTAVPAQSEFGSLRGTGNRVVVHSRYHRDNPLTISGAGAGAAMTASGVLADIMELVQA